MIIWELINGEPQPKIFCDNCGWECQQNDDGSWDYCDLPGMDLCLNCVKQNYAESVNIGENE